MTMSATDKRKSRDDSELLVSSSTAAGDTPKPSGIKGRLRRALSLSAAQAVESSGSASGPESAGADGASTAGKKKKSRTALFNSRLNASTDNISLSSTMSSASVVIRKLGSIGKLARRNSIAGITAIFKDKDKKAEDGDVAPAGGVDVAEEAKKAKKKGKKGVAVEPSVSHASIEVDRASATVEVTGLSPAAELARRHTLKATAQEAAAAKARAEAEAAAVAAAQASAPLPETWEKNTATRAGLAAAGASGGAYRVNEDGQRVLVEDDEDDEDWSRLEGEDDFEEETDMTIRQALDDTHLVDEDDEESVEAEPWAIGIRRSVERTRQPARGILKRALLGCSPCCSC
jgi:hypothetical protein